MGQDRGQLRKRGPGFGEGQRDPADEIAQPVDKGRNGIA